MGSCFSTTMGALLEQDQFQVHRNPFGIVYNPLTMAHQLQRLAEGLAFTADELRSHQGRWHSPWHHGHFSGSDPERVLSQINHAFQAGRQALSQADLLILTWGHNQVFEEIQSGFPVANCHKRPGHHFRERVLPLAELQEQYDWLLPILSAFNPKLSVVLTISPVRYLRRGFIANSRSKATLHLLAAHLESRGALYFPAWEILQDEWRDYRYYADDLVHPSPLGAKLIYQHFLDTWLDPSAHALLQEIRNLTRLFAHRPLHPDDPATTQLNNQRQERLARLRSTWPQYPHLFNAPAPVPWPAPPDPGANAGDPD